MLTAALVRLCRVLRAAESYGWPRTCWTRSVVRSDGTEAQCSCSMQECSRSIAVATCIGAVAIYQPQGEQDTQLCRNDACWPLLCLLASHPTIACPTAATAAAGLVTRVYYTSHQGRRCLSARGKQLTQALLSTTPGRAGLLLRLTLLRGGRGGQAVRSPS
jgi:hypothetical protein